MAAKRNVTVSVQPVPQRPTSAQRRAAVTEALANQQATLKQEAADRQRKRTEKAEATPAQTRRPHPGAS